MRLYGTPYNFATDGVPCHHGCAVNWPMASSYKNGGYSVAIGLFVSLVITCWRETGQSRMKHRCIVLITCLSCATIASILILHHPRRDLPALFVASDGGSETRSYVMALRYQEQLTSGVRNALQLSHLFKKHGSQLVEPFIAGTRLYGLHQHGHPLSTVLDFNAIARECYRINDIASFSDFLHMSTRDIVLLYPVNNPSPDSTLGQRKRSARDILPCLQKQGVCQCKKELGNYARSIEQSLNKLSSKENKFTVRQVICFNKLKPMTVGQFLKAAGLQETSQVYSYIFTVWWGTSCRMLETDSTGDVNPIEAKCPGTFRNRFIPETHLAGECGRAVVNRSLVSTEFLSPFLKDLATRFASSHRSGAGTKVSIHFRTEWLTVKYSSKVECCGPKIVETLKKIVNMYHVDNMLFVTDLGPFGSKTCDQECQSNGEQLVESIVNGTGLRPVHLDPVDYSVEEVQLEGSVIAPLVENAALADAEVLVVIGGGNYQNCILTSALQSTSLREVYSICSPSTLLNLPEGIVLHSVTCK